MTETYCDRYSAERVEKIETTVDCIIWFNNAEHEVKMELEVTYWQNGDWKEATCEVNFPDPLVVDNADDFGLDLKISLLWELRLDRVDIIPII